MRGQVEATEDGRQPVQPVDDGRPATVDDERRALDAIAARHGRPQIVREGG